MITFRIWFAEWNGVNYIHCYKTFIMIEKMRYYHLYISKVFRVTSLAHKGYYEVQTMFAGGGMFDRFYIDLDMNNFYYNPPINDKNRVVDGEVKEYLLSALSVHTKETLKEYEWVKGISDKMSLNVL